MLSVVHTRAQLGINAPLVTVETHLSNGLPGFTIVGLPEAAVKESKDRVRSAILNSHLEFPQKKITVNLAPADLPKSGGRFDLAIAIGILAASEQLPKEQIHDLEFVGELALSGELRAVKGIISASQECQKSDRHLVAPYPNNPELALCGASEHWLAKNLLCVCTHLHNRESLPHPYRESITPPKPSAEQPDLADVKGQAQARRALEIAAAGGHNLVFFGPPGTGKSMLASRITSILPPLSETESIEVAMIQSITGAPQKAFGKRPFRSPHHTSSAASMVGGGSNPKPGEISLAHKGVLFLDEFPEFPRNVLEVLREPLETGRIHISRANAQVEYPANFQLIAAMNPCQCGYFGDPKGRCRCTPAQLERYRNKISGPLIDRVDMHVRVEEIPISELQNKPQGECSSIVRKRVTEARKIQLDRQNRSNSELAGPDLANHCCLTEPTRNFLAQAMEKLQLSARAYDRILRVARTIADLGGHTAIGTAHVGEALAFRNLDRPV